MSPRATVTVREHARLTTAAVSPTLDRACVSPSAFDWLCNLAAGFRRGGAQLLQVEDRRWLRLDGYVGVVETPCGTRLEILPKHVDETGDAVVHDARALLRRMLATALDLPPREADEAGLEQFEQPLTEWVMRRFLLALRHVVQRGVRRDYLRVEETQRFLRGQLDVVRQLRQPPGREHLFNIRHDVFEPDRPENRLLKSALLRVCTQTQSLDNWRLSHELATVLAELPASTDFSRDFRAWRDDRLMAHYKPVRPWCELVLGRHMPLALAGETRGLSLLFPMERLFERTVAAELRRRLRPGQRLTPQSTRHALCRHEEQSFFTLKPDLLIEQADVHPLVVDAKWKRLDIGARNYGLTQADFYQLFAYGQKYQGGCGEMALIYPSTRYFNEPLKPFHFSEALTLWVLPFELQARPGEQLLPLQLPWHRRMDESVLACKAT